MKSELQDMSMPSWINELCVSCRSIYYKHVNSLEHKMLEPENDWDCSPYGETVVNSKPIDKAIMGQENVYEEVIELYKTYGGD